MAESFDHDVRIIGPIKVKASFSDHKIYANDALAIANAAMKIGLKYSLTLCDYPWGNGHIELFDTTLKNKRPQVDFEPYCLIIIYQI